MASEITFKTITLNRENFLNVINPDTQIQETQGYLSWNTGIFGSKNDNAMPDFLIDLYTNGAGVHQNLVNLKAQLITGNNLQAEDDTQATQINSFIARRNKAGMNLKQTYSQCAKDFALANACVLQVVYNRDGEIAEVYHVPFQNFRLGKMNKYGQFEFGYISQNWGVIANSRQRSGGVKDMVKIRLFDPTNWKKYPVQLLYLKDYSYSNYAIPSYTAALNWILISREISDFHLNNIRTNFFLSGMLVQKKGGMTEEQIEENAQAIEQFYKGKNGRKVLLSYVEDMINDKPVFEKFSGDDQDELFDVLNQQAFQQVVTAHNAYPILAGYDTKGADLGGDANKLNIALQAFNELVCEGYKDVIVSGLNRLIVDVNGLPPVAVYTEPLKINLPTEQPEDTTRNERRAILFGLPEIDESQNSADNTNQIPTA